MKKFILIVLLISLTAQNVLASDFSVRDVTYEQSVISDIYHIKPVDIINENYIHARNLGEIVGKNYKWYQKEKAFIIAANDVLACIVPSTQKIILKENNKISSSIASAFIKDNTLYVTGSLLSTLNLKYSKETSVYSVYVSTWQHVYEKELDNFLEEIKPKIEQKPAILAKYTTSFNAGNVNRTSNIKVASKAINGIILEPGKSFSFNKIVGRRTPQAGYKKAIVFINKEKVEDYGGGICQVSSTLYNAVYKAKLKILQRRSHSIDVTYVPKGMDATVSYGYIDFAFKNTKDYSIAIQSQVNKNKITITLLKL